MCGRVGSSTTVWANFGECSPRCGVVYATVWTMDVEGESACWMARPEGTSESTYHKPFTRALRPLAWDASGVYCICGGKSRWFSGRTLLILINSWSARADTP